MEATTQYFGKRFKQVLEYHRPSKILCQTSGRQNHWFLLYRKSVSPPSPPPPPQPGGFRIVTLTICQLTSYPPCI
jgi:hypothetical protein